MILVIHAHPYSSRSRAGAALLNAVRDLPDIQIHSLYERYPDFDIDVAVEQEAARAADLLVWLTPLYWYSVPALMKHWIDSVLTDGFAHSSKTLARSAEEGRKLCTKRCLWAVTTGGTEYAYSAEGKHEKSFHSFVAPLEQTARFCGMEWLPPHVVKDAHGVSDAVLMQHGLAFRQTVLAVACK